MESTDASDAVGTVPRPFKPSLMTQEASPLGPPLQVALQASAPLSPLSPLSVTPRCVKKAVDYSSSRSLSGSKGCVVPEDWMKRIEENQELQLRLLDECCKRLEKMHHSKLLQQKPSLLGAGLEPVGMRKSLLMRRGSIGSLASGGSFAVQSLGTSSTQQRSHNVQEVAETMEVRTLSDEWESSVCVSPRSPRGAPSLHVKIASKDSIANFERDSDCFSIDGVDARIRESEESSISTWVKRKSVQQVNPATAVWRLLEHSQSGTSAWIWSKIMVALIIGGVASSWAEATNPDSFTAPAVTIVLQACFAVELVLRFSTCPTRRLFFMKLYNVLDLVACLCVIPSFLAAISNYLDTWSPFDDSLFYIRIFVPAVMLLRLLRRFKTFNLLISAFGVAVEALPVLLYTMMVIVLVFAALLYLCEPRSSIAYMSDALWYVIVAMTTVGFHPAETIAGRTVSSFLFVLGVLYMAIPIGIIGNTFSQVWQDRHRLFVLQEVREQISWSAFTQEDIREMFEVLDADGDGLLSFNEFKELLPRMDIHITDSVAYSLFQTFDDDGEGTIDFYEFLMGVYPTERFFTSKTAARQTIRPGASPP